MSSNDDFFGGLKSDKDKTKEWTDAAQFYVDIRRSPEPEVIEPLPQEQEKTASPNLRAVGQAILSAGKKMDPTGLAKSMSSRPGLIAGLGGAALFGAGTALMSRGKKELGGESKLEHNLMDAKAERDAKPEPKSFTGKVRGHVADLSAGLASTARKHPLKAGLIGALGGAKAGTGILSLLTRKV